MVWSAHMVCFASFPPQNVDTNYPLLPHLVFQGGTCERYWQQAFSPWGFCCLPVAFCGKGKGIIFTHHEVFLPCAMFEILLAPLGALSRHSHRDSHPIPSIPHTYSFECSKPFYSDLKQTKTDSNGSTASKPHPDRIQTGTAWYSQVQPSTPWYSQVQPSTAWHSLEQPVTSVTACYSLVQPGRAWYSQVQPVTAW